MNVEMMKESVEKIITEQVLLVHTSFNKFQAENPNGTIHDYIAQYGEEIVKDLNNGYEIFKSEYKDTSISQKDFYEFTLNVLRDDLIASDNEELKKLPKALREYFGGEEGGSAAAEVKDSMPPLR